jgi:hypothetical protein
MNGWGKMHRQKGRTPDLYRYVISAESGGVPPWGRCGRCPATRGGLVPQVSFVFKFTGTAGVPSKES